MKTSELTSNTLDWAVAKCEGYIGDSNSWLDKATLEEVEDGSFHPSSNWVQGGPIIEREQIELRYDDGIWSAAHPLIRPKSRWWRNGPTPLIAAMRVFVASKLGDEIEIPEELL